MHLVEHLPKAVGMPDSMPPVEEERPDQPPREPLQERSVQDAQVNKRRLVRKRAVPDLVAGQSKTDLAQVDGQRATIPSRRVRERPAGPNPFEDEERRRGDDGEN